MSGRAHRVLTTALTLLGALAAALLVFLSLYRWDNKYTRPGPKALAGLLYLDGGQAEGLHFLTSEWEYYPDVLLVPGDFGASAPQPEQYAFIGGYSNFSAGQAQRSPHGQASYRLTVRLPEAPRTYALLMPDVYCAYRLYVNGRLLLEMGVPEAAGYTPRLGERTVAFEASGSVELLLAVAGREYITAGLTHPPAFGPQQAVARMQGTAMAVRAAVCALALLLGGLFLLIRLFSGYRMGLLYALLCACFLGCAAVPLARALLPMGLLPWNALYLAGNYGVYLAILLLQGALYEWPLRLRRGLAIAGGLVVALAVVVAVVPASPAQIGLFSALTGGYKWAMVGLMLAGALRASLAAGRYSAPLLWGVAFFGFALLADRLLPLHEPVLTGWFGQVAAFGVILLLGGVLWLDMARATRDRAAQHEALALAESRFGMLRAHYRELDAQVDTMRGLHHDFRQQLVLVRSLAEQQDWPRLQAFLDDYCQSASPGGQMVYCANETVNVITRYYAAACREAGIRFEAKYHLPAQLAWPDAALNAVLGNLLENAVAACRGMAGEDRFIRVTGSQKKEKGVFIVENSFEGTLRPRGAVFASTKPGGGQGLRSVQAAARQAGGSAIFTAADGRFTAMVVLGG